MPAGWVTTDGVYGADRGLRGWLEARQLPYVLAVKRTEPLTLPSGPPVPAARLVERILPPCWLRVSAGPVAKGRRWRVEEAFQADKGLCGLDQHQAAAGAPGGGRTHSARRH